MEDIVSHTNNYAPFLSWIASVVDRSPTCGDEQIVPEDFYSEIYKDYMNTVLQNDSLLQDVAVSSNKTYAAEKLQAIENMAAPCMPPPVINEW